LMRSLFTVSNTLLSSSTYGNSISISTHQNLFFCSPRYHYLFSLILSRIPSFPNQLSINQNLSSISNHYFNFYFLYLYLVTCPTSSFEIKLSAWLYDKI
jgi:hypothetical protein